MKEHPTLRGIIVSPEGLVYTTRKNSGGSVTSPRLLKGTLDRAGYVIYSFTEGKRKGHRLVAETFIPNPHNLRCVNHLDENKSNNQVGNLEWCDIKKNSQYSLCKYTYLVENIKTGEVLNVKSLNDFIRDNGLSLNLYKTFGSKKDQNQSGGYRVIDIIP
jgi:hypothetical protein